MISLRPTKKGVVVLYGEDYQQELGVFQTPEEAESAILERVREELEEWPKYYLLVRKGKVLDKFWNYEEALKAANGANLSKTEEDLATNGVFIILPA